MHILPFLRRKHHFPLYFGCEIVFSHSKYAILDSFCLLVTGWQRREEQDRRPHPLNMGYFGIFAQSEPPRRTKTRKKCTEREGGTKERRGTCDFAEEKDGKGKRATKKRERRKGER